MPLPLAAAAWPLISAGLATAGRFVVMRALPAAAEFATTRAIPALTQLGKSALTSAPSVAATTASTAWKAANIVATPIKHPVLTAVVAATAQQVTDGKSTELAIKGAGAAWDATKEYAPGVAAKAADAGLWVSEGMTGIVTTAGKMGIDHLNDKLPPILTPAPIRAAVAGAQAKVDHARGKLSGTTDGSAPAPQVTRDEEGVDEDSDFLDSKETGPFRDMIAKQLNLDPAKVNGKEITAKLGGLAKDNPYFAAGMAFGSIYGMMGEGKSKKERAMGAVMYGALFGVAFQFLGQMYPGLGPALMKMLGGVPDVAAKVPGAIGLNTSSLKGTFEGAAEGQTAAPTSAPAQGPSTVVSSQFAQAGSGKPAPASAPAPEDVDLRRNRPEAANNAAYRLSVGAPA